MPAKSPPIHAAAQQQLVQIAQGLRDRRLALGVSTVVATRAAGVSRVTWHRIEKAEPSVTMGAYAAALQALGLDLRLTPVQTPGKQVLPNLSPQVRTQTDSVPNTIPVQKYPQLRQLAWHVRDNFELTPEEAFGLYDRYRRHWHIDQMEPAELRLWRSLEKLH